ncbi:MAG: AbrB/MazE/SpoVT family DNA-binding domain-containing protein [Candidatus Binatus sp.]
MLGAGNTFASACVPFLLASVGIWIYKSQNIVSATTAKITVEKVGAIVLPKRVREQLQIAPGDELELESLHDRITLRPLRGNAQLRKKRGVWVFHCGEPLSASTVEETIKQVRREREEGNLGQSH